MTQLEWQQLEALVLHMTPEEKVRLLALVQATDAPAVDAEDPILGSIADMPELMDAIVEDAYFSRENHPLGLPPEE